MFWQTVKGCPSSESFGISGPVYMRNSTRFEISTRSEFNWVSGQSLCGDYMTNVISTSNRGESQFACSNRFEISLQFENERHFQIGVRRCDMQSLGFNARLSAKVVFSCRIQPFYSLVTDLFSCCSFKALNSILSTDYSVLYCIHIYTVKPALFTPVQISTNLMNRFLN